MQFRLSIIALALLASACFSPSLDEGLKCATDGTCPSGLTCAADGVCRAGATTPDSAVDDMQAEKIYDKIASIPGLRPHGFVITNYPSYS